MTQTQRMGLVLAMFLVGCGTEESREPRDGQEVTANETCADIEQVVEHVRQGLGSCTPNYKNEEPLAFSRATCNAEFARVCGAADQPFVQQYMTCLRAVVACAPANQSVFDEAIADCLDTFQNSAADGMCIELVVGD